MKKNLLIVDDEKYILQMLTEAFDGDDIAVACAGDGQQALDYVQKNNVDVVITDVMMPNLNGIDLFYELKKTDPFIQIIIITGYPSIKTIVEMLEAGATDFVIKPFEISKLKNIVKEAFSRIDRWRALRGEWIAHEKKMRQE